MIELKVEGYCQNCPEFEPNIERLYENDITTFTTITCEHAKRCECIRRFIERHIEKGLKDVQ